MPSWFSELQLRGFVASAVPAAAERSFSAEDNARFQFGIQHADRHGFHGRGTRRGGIRGRLSLGNWWRRYIWLAAGWWSLGESGDCVPLDRANVIAASICFGDLAASMGWGMAYRYGCRVGDSGRSSHGSASAGRWRMVTRTGQRRLLHVQMVPDVDHSIFIADAGLGPRILVLG